jgi:hypothetical protein
MEFQINKELPRANSGRSNMNYRIEALSLDAYPKSQNQHIIRGGKAGVFSGDQLIGQGV